MNASGLAGSNPGSIVIPVVLESTFIALSDPNSWGTFLYKYNN
jgi:hypothetical protein